MPAHLALRLPAGMSMPLDACECRLSDWRSLCFFPVHRVFARVHPFSLQLVGRWKKMGYSKEEVARDIAQEDGAFIVHSPAEGVGERVLAALTFRSRGNLVTRDILSDDQSTCWGSSPRSAPQLTLRNVGVYLQGSAQRFDGLPELVTYYVASPQTDLNVPNLLLPSQ
jgi:hypothetical protein